MVNKVNGLLGMTAKSGKIISGTEVVLEGISKGKVYLVIVATDSSEKTIKNIKNNQQNNDNFIKIPTSLTNFVNVETIIKKDNNGNNSYTKIGETGKLTYKDKKVVEGVTYTYVVKARRGSYTSYKSNAKKLVYSQ